jgi:beta-lactamase class A
MLSEGDKAGGSGVLPRMRPGLALTVLDLCLLMTIISDNTATRSL